MSETVYYAYWDNNSKNYYYTDLKTKRSLNFYPTGKKVLDGETFAEFADPGPNPNPPSSLNNAELPLYNSSPQMLIERKQSSPNLDFLPINDDNRNSLRLASLALSYVKPELRDSVSVFNDLSLKDETDQFQQHDQD